MRGKLLALMAIGATALPGQGNGPPPNPGVPLAAWQELHKDKNSASIYFRGDGTRPVTVNTVTTVACTNTRQPCGEYSVDLKVEPGQVVEALQLQRLDEKKKWSFAFWFEAGHQRQGSGAHRPDGEAATPPLPIDQLAPVAGATNTRGKCSTGVSSPSLPPKHRVLQLFFANDAMETTRSVTVWYDANGSAYRYEDWRGRPDIVIATPQKGLVLQSTVHSSTANISIHLDLISDNGVVVTSLPTGEISQSVTGPGLLTAEAIGRPGEMIARIWKECR